MNSPSQSIEEAELPSGITHYHESDRDVVTWSNRDLPINRWYFFLWPTIVLIFPTFFTWSLRHDLAASLPFLTIVWLIALFFVALIVRPYFWQETIMITDDDLVLSRAGFFAPKARFFTKENIKKISYDRYDDEGSGGIIYSLKVIYHQKVLNLLSTEHTEILAIFARTRELYQLFLADH